MFFVGLTILSGFTNAVPLSCISMNNQECKTRPQVINANVINFFPFIIKTSKCSDSCNNTNYPYAKICVPDVVKSLNVKVFNLECQELMKQDTLNGMKRANVSVNLGLMFVIINNIGIKINADVNAKN